MNQKAIDAAVSMARQSLYRLAALSFADPQTGSWHELDRLRGAALPADAAAILQNLPEARPAALGLGELPLTELEPQRLLDRLPSSPEAYNDEYEGAFGLLVSHACPPYQTEFIDGKFSYQRSHALADVSGFYRAFGLAVAERRPERQDHLALELEFMAFLIGMERQAGGPVSGGALCRQVCGAAQVRFLKEHLAWWAPAFARILCRENAGGFYEAAGEFLAALIPAERALLGVELESRPVAPTPLEQPEACDGCQLAGR
jgi:TorA maturation chaperone TorD